MLTRSLIEADRVGRRGDTVLSAYGRFMQPDPIGVEGGINLYAYTENDPVNESDPSGLEEAPIVVTASRCPEGWTCYSGGISDSARLPYPNFNDLLNDRVVDYSPIVVTAHRKPKTNPDPQTDLTQQTHPAQPFCPVHIPPGSIGRQPAQHFGPRSYEFHNGQDFPNPNGAGVYAPVSGVITSVFFNGKGGNSILMQSGRYRFGYAHSVAGYGIAPGIPVAGGQRVGSTNVSGHSTGPHLHFTVTLDGRKIDPLTFLNGACGQ